MLVTTIRNFALLTLLASCASHDLSRNVASNEFLSADEFEKELRFGAEWTFSNQAMLDSFPTDGNQVRVETSFSKQKVESLKSHLEKDLAGRPSKEKFKISGTNFHSHWRRQAYTISYPDKFEFTFFSDPGALEVNTSPTSLDSISRNRTRIQKDVEKFQNPTK